MVLSTQNIAQRWLTISTIQISKLILGIPIATLKRFLQTIFARKTILMFQTRFWLIQMSAKSNYGCKTRSTRLSIPKMTLTRRRDSSKMSLLYWMITGNRTTWISLQILFAGCLTLRTMCLTFCKGRIYLSPKICCLSINDLLNEITNW